MCLADTTRFVVSVFSISRLQTLWLASKSLGFSLFIPRIKYTCEDVTLSSRGRPPLRAGPVHFSCSIPGRKGFHFTMVKSSFKRHSLSRAEPPALTRSPGSRVLCSGTGLFTGTRHTWQCHCSLYHSLVSQRSSFRSRAKSSLRTYIGTNYLPLSNTNILGGRHFKYEENPNLGYLEMG